MSKPNLNLRFYLDKTEQQIRVEDSTDYSSLGIPLNEVFLALEIRTPAGLLYINPNYNIPSDTPDITGNIHIFTYTIPLVDNMLMRGVYTVNVNGLFNKANYKYSFSQVVDYGCKKPKIKHDIDCFCAKFKSTDITDYTGSTELTYEHIINYPSETNEPDITTILLEWSDNKLANGTYVSEVRTKREWSFGNGFYVIDEIYGKQDIKVKCECLCDIKCAFNSLWEKYQQNCGVNKSKADELLIKINKATTLLTLINANTKCGEVEKTDTYLSQIKDLLGECDCGCGGGCEDEQIWVSQVCGSSGGSGSPFNYIFNSCNSLINVNTTIHDNGQTKVVTICLNEQTINSLISNQFSILIEPILTALNLSWFNGLNTDCFGNFPDNGTEEQKKQFIIDTICQILGEINKPPVAKNDFSVILQNQNIEKLVTQNDFFTSNVTVTIVSAPLNGTATILPDGKTIKYIPNIGWSGIDSITYKITDQYGQFSTAIWQISVNAVASVGCAVVVPGCISEALPTNDNKVQFIITNTSALNGNVLLSEDYIINIYDISNTIIRSYPVAGSPTSDPTVFVSTHVIANTWNYFKVQQQISTGTTTGGTCGTVLFETEAYSLTDINTDIFAGTTAPCLGFSPTDTQQQKIQKLLNKLCAEYNISTTNGLNGVGSPLSPIKLGGELTQNTTIDGDKELNLLIRVLRLIQYDENSTYYNLLEVQNKKKYNNTSDFANFNVAISGNKKSIIDGVFNLSTIGTALEANSLSHDIEFINNTSSLDKSGVSAIGYGDVCNLSMGFGAQSTEAGHIDSMRNLTLSPIFKGNNSTPFTVDKYVSIAIMDLTQSFGTPSDWVIPTDRYAILQEGATDKNEFYGEIRYHSGLTNVSDIRSKKVIRKFEKGLDVVLNINPIVFKRLEHFGNSEIEQIGIIAQELEKVVPEIVNTSKQTIVTKSELINNENTGKVERKILEEKTIDDFKTYTPEALHFILINAIKELSTKCNDLEVRILKLEGNG